MIGISAALGSAASWAVGSILFKRIGETVTPFGMTLSKGIVSIFLLGAVLLFIGYDSISTSSVIMLCISGVLGITIGDTLFFAALRDLGPNTLIVFFMIGQIMTALLAVVFLGEIPPLKAWVGIVMTIIGIATVLWIKIMGEGGKGATGIRGIILGALFMISMSFSVIIAKPALASMSTIWATFIRMTAGTLGMLAFGMATRKVGEWLNPLRETKIILFFIASVCVVTFGGFWLSIVAIKYVDVAIANTVGATEPLFIIPLALIYLKERISALEILGTLLAVCGVILICTS